MARRESDRPGQLLLAGRPWDFGDIDPPVVNDDEVLVRVRGAAVNPPAWAGVTGVPYIARLAAGLRRPRNGVRGSDVARTEQTIHKVHHEVRSLNEAATCTQAR